MGLEAATYISQLVATNPLPSDLESQGANHLQLIKSVLQNSFPSAVQRGFYFPSVTGFQANASLVNSHQNAFIFCDTQSFGPFTLTLPSLGLNDAGWTCTIFKLTTDINPYFIAPPTGTIQSGEVPGLAKTRRAIPGHPTQVWWTGTAWFATRVPRVPIGTILDFQSTTLPAGYEWPDGAVLNTSNYPDYAAVLGGGAKVDARSQVFAAPDNLGTGGKGIWPAAVFGQALGEVNHTLALGETPNHSHTFSGTTTGQSADHSHLIASGSNILISNPGSTGAGTSPGVGVGPTSTGGTSNDHTHGFSGGTTAVGSGGAHNNVQLTTILSKILVVE